MSGLTVALVLIPQSMAYAQLAGLPPYYGLYASLLPPFVGALFGSSNQLATGPVAVISLMTSTALAPLATQGSQQYIAYAILLALMVGICQFILGILRLGVLVNFLSHPVVRGFTNAAAIIIATSQLSKLFGVYVDKTEHHYETVINVIRAALHYTHWPTIAFAALAFFIMIGLRKLNPRIPNILVAVVVCTIISMVTGYEKNAIVDVTRIRSPEVRDLILHYNKGYDKLNRAVEERIKLRKEAREREEKEGKYSRAVLALHHRIAVQDVTIRDLKEDIAAVRAKLRNFHFVAVKKTGGVPELYPEEKARAGMKTVSGTWRLTVGNQPLKLSSLKFMSGGAVVGTIPQGLPKISMPAIDFQVMSDLAIMAIIIAMLGFMESISIAKAMATKTKQSIDPNQELIGQGLANIVGSFNQSYPVAGSFSRSAVNMSSGAVTGLSMAFSSLIVLLTLLFLTPLLYHLPQAVLAAIIIMAVVNLVNPADFAHAWKAQKYDGAISVITFVSTLAYAPHLDKGILIGVGLSLAHYLYRNMRPDMATLSKWKDGTYRDADRRRLEKCEHIAVIRFNNSLFFANVNYLEEKILEPIAKMPHLRYFHIVCNGINELDASGVETLAEIIRRVRDAGYGITFSGFNEEVKTVIKRTELYDLIGRKNIYGSVALAVENIHEQTHKNSTEKPCPLLEYVPLDM